MTEDLWTRLGVQFGLQSGRCQCLQNSKRWSLLVRCATFGWHLRVLNFQQKLWISCISNPMSPKIPHLICLSLNSEYNPEERLLVSHNSILSVSICLCSELPLRYFPTKMPRAGSDYFTSTLDARVVWMGSCSVLKAAKRRTMFSIRTNV